VSLMANLPPLLLHNIQISNDPVALFWKDWL